MKKKLRLQIEKLRVEQFEVQPGTPVVRGTVHGHMSDLGCYSDGDVTCYCGVGPSEPHRLCLPMPGSQYLYFTECC
ncbi:MAG TPA: hypothetical protein VE871_05990 [Longimicrobium sp.]|nr:hypothetical protein [Longimicrobium sp.]